MTGSDPLDDARQAYQEARAAIAQYRLKDAREQIDLARSLLTTSGTASDDMFELDIRLQVTESWLVSDSDGLAAALEQVADARRRALAAGRDDLRAAAHIQAGVLRARAGFVEDALAELRPAVELSHHLPVEDRVRLLLNKGTMASEAGHFDEAAADLAEAARLAVDLPDHAFMATHNLGFVEYLQGDLPAALRSMHAADDMDVSVDRSVSRLDRARVLLEVGLLDDAAELLGATVADMREAGMAEEVTGALLDQARCALLRGRSTVAVELAAEAATRAAERGERPRELAAEGIRIEAQLASGSAGPELAEAAAGLVPAADEAGLEWLADRATALCVIAGGDVADAERLARLRESPYLATRLLGVRAVLGAATDPAQRRELVASVIDDVAAAKSGMASLDLRTALTVHVEPIIDLDLAHVAATGDPALALQTTERWRAALDTVPSVTPSPDPEVARLWALLRKRHEDLRAPSPAPELQGEVARLEHELRERSWRGRNSRSAEAGDDRWRRGPREGSTLLSYFWADGKLHLVRVEPRSEAVLHPLGSGEELGEIVARASADATALARAGFGPLAAAVRSSLDEALELLDGLILPASLADGPVVVIPSGALSRLPWGMLPRLRRRSLTIAKSAEFWHRGATLVDGSPGVAVASGPELALADDEARQVCATWPGSERVAGEPAAVREALATREVVHIAAHGQHRADNPLFSSLRLHGGSLFAHELEGSRMRASLVVLSACGAGRARLLPGDEALGLTSSLLALGVQAVVAPMTDVPDEVARDTMTALHEGLASGLDGPAALAAAAGDDLLARSFTWFGSDWRVTGG